MGSSLRPPRSEELVVPAYASLASLTARCIQFVMSASGGKRTLQLGALFRRLAMVNPAIEPTAQQTVDDGGGPKNKAPLRAQHIKQNDYAKAEYRVGPQYEFRLREHP